MTTDDEGILGRIRREAQAEDDRLPRYHEDRPGRLPNNGITRPRPTCPDCGQPLNEYGECVYAAMDATLGYDHRTGEEL